jgi:hypothetical protein
MILLSAMSWSLENWCFRALDSSIPASMIAHDCVLFGPRAQCIYNSLTELSIAWLTSCWVVFPIPAIPKPVFRYPGLCKTGKILPGSLAWQPCRIIKSLITGRRPAELQAFLRPYAYFYRRAGSLVQAFPAINKILRFWALCTNWCIVDF